MQPIRAILITLNGLALLGILGCGPAAKLQESAMPTNIDTAAALLPRWDSIEAVRADKAYVFNRISSNIIPFRTFSAKMKIDYQNDKGVQETLTAFVHMQQDSAIWIAVTPLLGIEVARLLITPDSVKLMDKMHKTLTVKGTDLIEQLINIPMNFRTLQDMIIGNPVYFSAQLHHFSRTPSLVSFTCRDSTMQNEFDVFADDYRLQQCRISDTDTTLHRHMDITYGDYTSVDGMGFSTLRKIFVMDRSVEQITLHFTRVRFNVPMVFPFYVPSDYQRK
ncbi:MAG TPA: DUF4292 domain-containing protein [Chitinophagaceae bacterium]|nr:DUF4292 domain-containing protein [Chitinophagaceae bacterium]